MSKGVIESCAFKKPSNFFLEFIIFFSFFSSMRLVLKLPIPYAIYIEVGILLVSCLFIVWNYFSCLFLKHRKCSLSLYELYILSLIFLILSSSFKKV